MSDFSNRNRNAFEHSQKPEIITTNQKTNLSIHIEIENRTPSPESTTIFPSSICKKKVSSVIWCWRFKASSTLHNALTRNARRTVAGSGWCSSLLMRFSTPFVTANWPQSIHLHFVSPNRARPGRQGRVASDRVQLAPVLFVVFRKESVFVDLACVGCI